MINFIKNIIILYVAVIPQLLLAEVNADSLEKILNQKKGGGRVDILLKLADLHAPIEPVQALEYATEARKIATNLNIHTQIAEAEYQIGTSYIYNSELKNACDKFVYAAELFIKQNNKSRLSSCYNNLGILHKIWGNLKQSLEYYNKALEIRLKLNDEKGIAGTLNNIAVMHSEMGDEEKALEYYYTALKYFIERNNQVNIAVINNNIGMIYANRKEFQKSLEHYRIAIKNNRESNSLKSLANTLNNIGELYQSNNMPDTALYYYKQSLSLFKELGSEADFVSPLTNIGNLYWVKSDFDRSMKYFNKSLMLAEKLNLKSQAVKICNYIARNYKVVNDFKSALKYYEKSMAYSDSVFSSESRNLLSEIQFKYETVKKDNEIELLKKDKELKENQRNFLIAISALVIILTILILNRFRLKQKTNILLEEKNKELSELNDAKDKYLSIINFELERASSYALSLLPEKIDDKFIKTDFKFVPSSTLGGDALGYQWLDKDNFSFYLLDVSGHGIGSALHSSSVLSSLKFETLPNADFKTPSNVLFHLNSIFKMKDHSNLYFTVWYGVYNKLDRTLKYASAGHPPAFLIDADNHKKLSTRNICIGGFTDFNFIQETIQIEKGTRIFIYSDGVYEIRSSEDSKWNISELFNYIKSNKTDSGLDPAKIYSLVQDINRKKNLDDDFSILEVVFK
ncbi:SpoIIE family protein phosphatase [Bacteroidota bacterium]